MKQIKEIILEMSALKNRDNERLSQEKDNHYNEIHRIEKEQQTNSSNDKKRVLKACGLNGAGANSAYDTAIEMANEILKADKPYGAFYFILAHTMDIANIKQQTEIVETLKKLFNSQELNELVSVDKNYKKLQAKIEKKVNISKEANEKANKLAQELIEMESKYKNIHMLNTVQDNYRIEVRERKQK